MSSTNKTTNLGLPQWEASDPVERADFNDSFARIDDGIGHKRLLDFTVTKQTGSVNLDLSGIDLDQFAELRLYFSVRETTIAMRVNNNSETNYVRYTYSDSSSHHDTIVLMPCTTRINIGRGKYHIKSDMSAYRYEMSRDVFPKINSLNLYYGNSSVNFEPGDRITIWGMLR